eukprot:363239-Chlamydomonas_euryale.AAC.7
MPANKYAAAGVYVNTPTTRPAQRALHACHGQSSVSLPLSAQCSTACDSNCWHMVGQIWAYSVASLGTIGANGPRAQREERHFTDRHAAAPDPP